MPPSTISEINRLPFEEKRQYFIRAIPPQVFEMFNLSPDLIDEQGRSLIEIKGRPGSVTAEMRLYHEAGFPDPIWYGQITDTMNGQLHVLLYVLNDPNSPRFNVDRMPDGTPTQFGILCRNLEAEEAAMRAGLAPGQIRHGLRLLRSAVKTFDDFVASLGHELYFAEPLYYHNAILFERYGFNYQQGRKLMERINAGFAPAGSNPVGFAPGGDLLSKLDGSTPFRQPDAANSIRLRSWAIHDGILDQPFTNVTMYKRIEKHAGISTCDGCSW